MKKTKEKKAEKNSHLDTFIGLKLYDLAMSGLNGLSEVPKKAYIGRPPSVQDEKLIKRYVDTVMNWRHELRALFIDYVRGEEPAFRLGGLTCDSQDFGFVQDLKS